MEIHEDLVFHGGSGSVLEMREFGQTALQEKLLGAGFCEVSFLTSNVPEWGILFDHDVSQPLIARKQPFLFDAVSCRQLVDGWVAAEERWEREQHRAETLLEQTRMASHSRWLRLGRKLGVGPRFR